MTLSYLDLMHKDAQEVKAITSKIKFKSPATESSYATKLKNAMTVLPTDISVLKGIPVMRITSRGVWKPRVITLSSDKQAFFITHSKIAGGVSSAFASTLPIPLFTPSKGFRWANDAERYVRHLDIADINGWQVGAVGVQKLELAKEPVNQRDVDNLLTIFHHGSESMCFIVPDKENCKHLVEALKRMKSRYNLMSPWINNDQLLLRYIYYDVDENKSGTIDKKEFRQICKRINFSAPSNVDKEFKKISKKGKEISIEKALSLLNEVAIGDTKMPVDLVWDDVFGSDVDEVGPEKLLQNFLLGCQGESASTLAEAERLIESMNSLGKPRDSKTISKPEFVHFLHSKYNDAFDPAATAELSSDKKLDLPISRYWINTSHNTYLVGDQLQSRSSVEAYQNALNRGCKCLELDCWNSNEVDSKTNEPVPIIYHGHTLTPSMTFRSACLVVQNYLLANPDSYPIILSLENHCNLAHQKVMAKEMNEIFGEKLFIPTEEQFYNEDLPSPEKLRGMVVIKGKRPPEPDDEGTNESTTKLLEDYDDGFGEDDIEPASPTPDSGKSGNVKHKGKVESDLKKVTLLHGYKHECFHISIKEKATSMHSIGETKIPKLVDKIAENATLWRKYNLDHMTRTYPAGARVDSSNYNPILAWAVGCQLVALNFQTHDSNLSLNDGLFRQAGKCGYVPKPGSIMGGEKSPQKKAKIHVLSARCLPKPKGAKTGELIDPYIQIDLHDVRVADTGKEKHVKKSFETSTVDNNGFNPVWKKGTTAEFEIHNPDVAMIHFRIIDDDLGSDDKIASSAIPVACMRKGYRSIQLYDRNDTRTGPFESSILFVKIEC